MTRNRAAKAGPRHSPAGRAARMPAWLRLLAVFAGSLALTLWVRRVTFAFSVLDWDESLYLLVSRGVLQGHLPYTVIYDNKPPGIYFLFALGQVAFGHSVIAVRILTCIAVAATCTGLEAIGRVLAPGRAWSGLFAGFLYTVCAVAVDPASNTELFFAPFCVAAILIALTTLRPGGTFSRRQALGAGLLAGVALQIKPFALIELAGVGAWGVWKLRDERRSLAGLRTAAAGSRAAAFTVGLLLPAMVIAGVFALSGHLPEYLDANVRANRVLASLIHADPAELAANTWRHALRFWPLWGGALLSVLAWALAGRPNRGQSGPVAAVLVWFACTMLAVGIVGGRFPHYYLEPLVPLSLIAAWGAGELAARASGRFAGLEPLLLVLLAGAVLWLENEPLQRMRRNIDSARESSGIAETGDPAAMVARRIRAEAAPGDRLYVVDYEPVLYFLLDLPAPTRYAFPPFLADSTLNRVANVDAAREVRSILSTAPRLLVRSRPLGHRVFYEALDPLVDRFYDLDVESPPLRVYRLRGGAADSLRKAASGVPGGW